MKLFFMVLACLALSSGIASGIPRQHPLLAGGTQKLVIRVDNGFSPSDLTVQAGLPVKIVFRTVRRCGATVVFKDLKLERRLTNGKTTTIVFTPTALGSISFACSKGTHKGVIQVRNLAQRV